MSTNQGEVCFHQWMTIVNVWHIWPYLEKTRIQHKQMGHMTSLFSLKLGHAIKVRTRIRLFWQSGATVELDPACLFWMLYATVGPESSGNLKIALRSACTAAHTTKFPQKQTPDCTWSAMGEILKQQEISWSLLTCIHGSHKTTEEDVGWPRSCCETFVGNVREKKQQTNQEVTGRHFQKYLLSCHSYDWIYERKVLFQRWRWRKTLITTSLMKMYAEDGAAKAQRHKNHRLITSTSGRWQDICRNCYSNEARLPPAASWVLTCHVYPLQIIGWNINVCRRQEKQIHKVIWGITWYHKEGYN